MNIDIDPKLQKDVEEILAGMGLSKKEAIKIFFQEIKNKGHFPFPFNEMKKYNQETLKAIEETDAGINTTEYENFDEFKKAMKEELKNC